MARSAKKSAASSQPQEGDVARPPQPQRFNASKDQLLVRKAHVPLPLTRPEITRGPIDVHCDSSTLTAGTFPATFVVSDSDAGTTVTPQTVTVTLTVS